VPVFVIPTTYFSTGWRELAGVGASGVIYANQVIRATVRVVEDLLESIIKNGSAADKEDQIASISELFDLVGMHDLLDSEPWTGLDNVTVRGGQS
jgi:phosphoenolpyruvate phosphomutase